VVVAITAAWSGLSLVRAGVRRRLGLSGAVAVAAVAAQAGYVLSALRMVEAGPAVYRSLLGAPRIVGWKFSLWARQILERDEVAWVRTPRNPIGDSGSRESAGEPAPRTEAR
jgi:hypothetical protein